MNANESVVHLNRYVNMSKKESDRLIKVAQIIEKAMHKYSPCFASLATEEDAYIDASRKVINFFGEQIAYE